VGADGTDGLFNIEYAQFSDQIISLASNSSYVITSYAKASFAENGTGTVYTAAAADMDANTTLTYVLGGLDAALFNINSSTGVITFKAAPNYELPTDFDVDNTYNITVRAFDGTYYSDAQAIATTITNVGEAGEAIIDLGAYGKLIAPVQVDGGKWYYYYDKNGDGISSSSDTVTHNDLDGIFIYDINGVLGGNGNTNDTYRYATINGTQLALPTYGSSASLPSTYSSIASPGTTNGSSSNSDNTTYNDLLAIWDAYNQTGTSTFIPGVPSGWATGYYWASSPSTLGHANVGMGYGTVWNSPDSEYNYVAVQVL
jgi:hypothetical protein